MPEYVWNETPHEESAVSRPRRKKEIDWRIVDRFLEELKKCFQLGLGTLIGAGCLFLFSYIFGAVLAWVLPNGATVRFIISTLLGITLVFFGGYLLIASVGYFVKRVLFNEH